MSLSLAQGRLEVPLDEFRRMWSRVAVAAAIAELETLPGSLRPTLPDLEHFRWNRGFSGDTAGLRSLAEG